MAIGGIVAVNIRFGMDRSLIRDLTHFPEKFNHTLVASLLARVTLLVLSITGLLLVKELPFANLELSMGMFLIILATALDPLQITNVFDVWEAQGRDALYLCMQRGTYFLLIWGAVLVAPGHLGLDWIGMSLLTASVFMLSLQFRYAWGRIQPSFCPSDLSRIVQTAFDLIKKNRWLWMTSVAALGMTALNNVLLKHLAGFADLGVYAASFQLVSLGTLLLKNISRIGRPILARYTTPGKNTQQEIFRFLALYLASGCFAVSCIAMPIIVFPKEILETLFTDEYASGFWVLRIFGVYLFFRVFDTILGQYIVLMRVDRSFFFTSTISGILSTFSCLILSPIFGAIGAASSLLFGEVFLSMSYIYITKILMKRKTA